MFSLFSDPEASLRIQSFSATADGRLLIEVASTDPREIDRALYALSQTQADQVRPSPARRRAIRAA